MQLKDIKAVIFDLDGVIVSTDDCHYEAWQKLADDQGIYFDRDINQRLRGVSRMESLEILLERATHTYTDEEKNVMATEKNEMYKRLVMKLTPSDILPGAMETLVKLRKKGILIAIGSSSRNTPIILKQIGLEEYFDAVADGNHIKNSKPDPEVFLLAAKILNIPPENCLVVEDADAGVEAALNGHMKVLGVGSAAQNPRATIVAGSLKEIELASLIS
jgi:beta-phosphoglucomutase